MLYQVGVDGDDDGFICWDAQAGDALNLLPWPVSHAGIDVVPNWTATVEHVYEEIPCGLWRYRCVTGTHTLAGMLFGSELGLVIDDIPVAASTQYTWTFWVKGDVGAIPMYAIVWDQTASITAHPFTLSTSWQKVDIPFTTGASSTHTMIVIRKNADATDVTFDAAGFMLVAGSTAPTAFNAGDASNYDDAAMSDDMTRLEWRLGLEAPYEEMAAPNRATVHLRNQSKVYSPEAGGDALERGRLLQIRSVDSGDTVVHFTGYIDRVEPLPGVNGERTAVIHASSADSQLHAYRVRLPPQVNQASDAIIGALLDSVPLRRRTVKGLWILGLDDHGELGAQTVLPGETVAQSLESGRSTLAYAADTWDAGLLAADAIRQIVGAERGRFYVDRGGSARFLNRHHLILDTSVQASFEDDMDGLTYRYGAEFVSEVRVNMLPRSVGSASAVLWEAANAQLLPSGRIQRITVRFRDDNDRPIGALALDDYVDYAANTAADGSGLDRTQQVDVVLRQVDFSAAVLEVRNRAQRDVYLLAGTQIRGIPVYQGNPVTVTQYDDAARTLYGQHSLTLNLPALDSVEEADQVARFELGRRRSPRGLVGELVLKSPAHRAQMIARTLFDRITVTETQTGHSADYFIVAEQHSVDRGGSRHETRWLLEAAAANTYWLLDVNQLDVDAVVAY
ncbi:MAG: hypothetical protein K8L99_09045 [Anaerolineae bacterium]|nr:hypothetical protein [Anaerolineae bacterium]